VGRPDRPGAFPEKEGRTMVKFMQSLRRREDGQALVEYALILFLIAVVSIGVLTVLGTNVSTVLLSIANAI
jgi:pilus assembly protein Flp/PilA